MASPSIGSSLSDEEINYRSDFSDGSSPADGDEDVDVDENNEADDDDELADSPLELPASRDSSADVVEDVDVDVVEDSVDEGDSADVIEDSDGEVYSAGEVDSADEGGSANDVDSADEIDSADEGDSADQVDSADDAVEYSDDAAIEGSLEDAASDYAGNDQSEHDGQDDQDDDSASSDNLYAADSVRGETDSDEVLVLEGDSPAMPRTRRQSPAAATATLSQPSASQRPAASQDSAGQRSALKRRRSNEPEAMSRDSLPPISSIIRSIGTGASSGSQSSQPRPRTEPKRPKREDPVVIDILGSDDDVGVDMVNLVDVDRPRTKQEAEPEPEPEPEPEHEPEPPLETLVKFSGLQCVICMDDMSNLTVTHCGHLFCGECLHSSLTMGNDRKICPICRTKLELRVAGMTQAKMARSYFPLVVKLRSANKQGKQPARPA